MFWQNLWNALKQQFFTPEKLAQLAGKLVSIIAIVLALLLVGWIAGLVVKRLLQSRRKLMQERHTRTVLTISRSIIRYALFFVGIVMILRVLGVDYTAILAGAGVVGLAVGFGAQTLVRDFLSGFFLLFEDVVSIGDVIKAGNVAGLVEHVGLRATHLRGFDGVLNVVPNGELTTIGNFNRGWMRAIVTVDLAYEQDVERGMAVAKQAVDQWANEHKDIVIEPPVVQGIIAFNESGVTIRTFVKLQPMKQWQAEWELRAALKKAFDQSDVEIPFPRRVVYNRMETGSSESGLQAPKS